MNYRYLKLSLPFLLILLVALINIVALIFMSSGYERYSGTELQAAYYAVDTLDGLDEAVGTYYGFTRARVSDIRFTPGGDCIDPTDYKAYSYTVETVSWFGIIVVKRSDSICHHLANSITAR